MSDVAQRVDELRTKLAKKIETEAGRKEVIRELGEIGARAMKTEAKVERLREALNLRTFSTQEEAIQHGDAVQLWVNEGDLQMLRMLAASE